MIEGARNFKLINKTGAEYDITRPEALFWEPDGLGWGYEPEYSRLGMTFTTLGKLAETERQAVISGNMVFRTYDEYHNFLIFCQVGGLSLAYMPHYIGMDLKWFYVDVIVSIDKSEIKPDNNHLVCPVTFTAVSYWYDKQVAQTAQQGDDLGGKVYTYTYPYRYGVGASNVLYFDVPLASYFKLYFMGAVTNPRYDLYVGDTVVASGKFFVTADSSQMLVIDTNPKTIEASLYLKTGAYVNDVYQTSDFTKRRFFAIPAGESRMIVQSDDVDLPTVMIEVQRHV